MARQTEIGSRPSVPANIQLMRNAEHIAWQAHQLASEIADNDPNAVTQTLRRAVTAQWQRTFLDLPQ